MLILLTEQFNKRKQDYLILQRKLKFKDQVNNTYSNNGNNSNMNRSLYDGNVDNDLCDMIRGIYDNDFNINSTNNNTIHDNIYDITLDDMIKVIHDSNNKTMNNINNNDKFVDLQIQLAMLWRIISMIKKSNTNILLYSHI
jgi:hypothetical protein